METARTRPITAIELYGEPFVYCTRTVVEVVVSLIEVVSGSVIEMVDV